MSRAVSSDSLNKKKDFGFKKKVNSTILTVFLWKSALFHIPVTQVTLECKQVFVEALDGFLLQDIVNAVSSVQQAHFDLWLVFL